MSVPAFGFIYPSLNKDCEFKSAVDMKKAIERVKVKGRITNKEYVDINKVSRITATRELMDMVRKKNLKQEGRGRGSRFTPMMQL